MPGTPLNWAFALEPVTRAELAFTAWEGENVGFGDLRVRTYGLFRRYIEYHPVPASHPYWRSVGSRPLVAGYSAFGLTGLSRGVEGEDEGAHEDGDVVGVDERRVDWSHQRGGFARLGEDR